jgi:hypothetical protein
LQAGESGPYAKRRGSLFPHSLLIWRSFFPWVRLPSENAELVVSGEHETLRIRATSIDTLWTRGHSAKQGFIIGAIAGTLAGVTLGLLYGESTTEHDFSNGEAMVLAGGIGAVGGEYVSMSARGQRAEGMVAERDGDGIH